MPSADELSNRVCSHYYTGENPPVSSRHSTSVMIGKYLGVLTAITLSIGLNVQTELNELRRAPAENLRRIDTCIDHNTAQIAEGNPVAPMDVFRASNFCFRMFYGAQIPLPVEEVYVRSVNRLTEG